jgi:hypothetical protein
MNQWFTDEKKFTRAALEALKTWVQKELDKLK